MATLQNAAAGLIQAGADEQVGVYGCLQEMLKAVGVFLYGNPYLLSTQIVLGLIAAEVCAYKTQNPSQGFKFIVGFCTSLSFVYLGILYVAFKRRQQIKTWFSNLNKRYWLVIKLLLVVVIVGLIRLFVFVAACLEKENDLDGYSTAFFLLAYLHIVSICKLYRIEDFLCLSDSLLAIAIFVASRLDHTVIKARSDYTVIEQIYDLGLLVSTAPAPSPTHVRSVWRRTVASYLSAVLLACFRFSNIPFDAPAHPVAPTIAGAGAPTEALAGAGVDLEDPPDAAATPRVSAEHPRSEIELDQMC